MDDLLSADTLFHVAHTGLDVWVLWTLRRRRGLPGLAQAVVRVFGGTGLLAIAFTLHSHSLGFGLLTLLTGGLFVHLPIVLLGACVLLRRESRIGAWGSLGGLALLLGIYVEGFVIGPTALEVSHVRVVTSKLSEPVRIAVLADIQTERVGEYERRAVRLALAEQPDLVLLPGDFVQSDDPNVLARERRALRRMFAEEGLDAPLGVHVVGGNTDSSGWEAIFRGLPVRVYSQTSTTAAGALQITGLSIRDSRNSRLRVSASDGFQLVFGHYPDFALGDVRADLLVAGHCHGGQVRIPFFGPPITLSAIPREWTSGAHEIRPGSTLVVSRGIGMERMGAPPVRFLCRPEVVIIDVVPIAE